MKNKIDILKGIHPGKIIARELKKRGLSQRRLASMMEEHSQTLNAVITGHRHLTIEMALKIERALGYEEGFLSILQTFYDIAKYKSEEANRLIKGVPNIRRILFWDTDFDRIDWGKYKDAVIKRVLERGNSSEKREIARFYGLAETELHSISLLGKDWDEIKLDLMDEMESR